MTDDNEYYNRLADEAAYFRAFDAGVESMQDKLEAARAEIERLRKQRDELVSMLVCIFDEPSTLYDVRYESRPYVAAIAAESEASDGD